MESYYKKVCQKSIKTIVIGIALFLLGGYFVYDHWIGSGSVAKDRMSYIIFGAVLIAMGIWVLLLAIGDGRALKKKIAAAGIGEDALAEDLNGGITYSDCSVGEKYALQCKGRPDLIVWDDVLIAHMDVESTTSKGYSSYSYYVRITTRNGEDKYLSAKDEEELRGIFAQITEKRPYLITEMNSMIRELKKKNMAELIRLVEQRRGEYESGEAD